MKTHVKILVAKIRYLMGSALQNRQRAVVKAFFSSDIIKSDICFERCFISNKVMEIHIMNIFLIYKETLHCLSSKTFFNIILGDRFILELKINWEGYN